jgi:acetoin utilization deacetylase AcuC-like enzyme
MPGVVQVDIAVSWGFDRYPPPQAPGSLNIVENAEEYLGTIERALRVLEDQVFDVCLYNAGMDPHEDCDIGGLDGITTDVLRERERRFFDWAAHRQLPVAFVLAGGYASARLTNEAIVGLHRLTIEAAVGVAR